ncbi:hypothetical protein TELCIR_03033 [Teladorsagia circumcincta]|uniref:Uncharacterized protein n=1 Tax=Teladorsagia circumcincta TaxID=45464 RepID=A0A2G9UYY3_TELCI|nr:hypothetical protein TELCIR_03033 [Teladorsagia circumcincta]
MYTRTEAVRRSLCSSSIKWVVRCELWIFVIKENAKMRTLRLISTQSTPDEFYPRLLERHHNISCPSAICTWNFAYRKRAKT